jgi:CDP-glucose 4,6-dehydratase
MIWAGRRVFLTGHTGFKGGWIALWLAHLGAEVRGYSLDPYTTPSLFDVARIGERVEDVRGDIRNATALDSALTDFAPEVVFHLAAQPLVRLSYADPITTYETNVIGTARVLDAVRRTPSVRAVVAITTDKCYENKEWADTILTRVPKPARRSWRPHFAVRTSLPPPVWVLRRREQVM